MRGIRSPGEREGHLRERLQQAAEISLPDFFTFIVGEESLALDQAPAGGSRFPVDARLDGRTFVKFHVDLGLGDEVLEPTERLSGEDWLGFAGIPPVNIPALSAEQHWAEKLHAYTLPRGGATNSRAKDLVDLVMLIEWHALRPGPLREAVRATFNRRRTHAVPTTIPAPPSTWTKPFAALATECGLRHTHVVKRHRFTEYRHPRTLHPGATQDGRHVAGVPRSERLLLVVTIRR